MSGCNFMLRVRSGGSRFIVVLKKRHGGFAMDPGDGTIDITSEGEDNGAPSEFSLISAGGNAEAIPLLDLESCPDNIEGCHDIFAATSNVTADQATWSGMVMGSFCQFSALPSEMQFPWEQGVMRDIFDKPRVLKLPWAAGMEPEDQKLAEPHGHPLEILEHEKELTLASAYAKAVRNIRDLEYFEDKQQRLELACSTWMDILSVEWRASSVGFQLSADFQRDASGELASETLKSVFGVKSPATLLKRSSAMKQYFSWHYREFPGVGHDPLPLREEHVWEYFLWLREVRRRSSRGYTTPSSFLETVRFLKFTLGLIDTELILQSKRLLGFAAIEKRYKGPTVQSPPMELEHLQRLHSIVETGSCNIDRLGAAVMLICIYARARWSDIRYIDHVEIERKRNGCLVLFTKEHKTSSVGDRRQQYLPLIVPWHGVVQHDWLNAFLELYSACGLGINKQPLGPLLPAPKAGGGFNARPLTTQEASCWLRLLLEGTENSSTFRSHSLKCTLLVWSAKAGLDKEVRAVLGHHCSALHGSEVVYSRHLQTRAIRKLQMMIHRIRVGLGLEEDVGGSEEFQRLAVGLTPVRVGAPQTPGMDQHVGKPTRPELEVDVLGDSLAEVLATAELESVKEEADNIEDIQSASKEISLFDEDIVKQGLVSIDSSSGSDSSSTSDESDIEENPISARGYYSESAPEGKCFVKHRKSHILHLFEEGAGVTQCKVKISQNFLYLPDEIDFKYPKCIRCFPRNSGRLRSVDSMAAFLESAAKARKISSGPV